MLVEPDHEARGLVEQHDHRSGWQVDTMQATKVEHPLVPRGTGIDVGYRQVEVADTGERGRLHGVPSAENSDRTDGMNAMEADPGRINAPGDQGVIVIIHEGVRLAQPNPAPGRASSWWQGQNLNLRPSGYEPSDRPSSPYQPVPDRAPTLGSEPSLYLGRVVA